MTEIEGNQRVFCCPVLLRASGLCMIFHLRNEVSAKMNFKTVGIQNSSLLLYYNKKVSYAEVKEIRAEFIS